MKGYRAIALADLKNARLLSRALEKSGMFCVLSDIHRPAGAGKVVAGVRHAVGFDETNIEVRLHISKGADTILTIPAFPHTSVLPLCMSLSSKNYEAGLPVVAFRFSDDFKSKYPDIQQKWIQVRRVVLHYNASHPDGMRQTLLRSKGCQSRPVIFSGAHEC